MVIKKKKREKMLSSLRWCSLSPHFANRIFCVMWKTTDELCKGYKNDTGLIEDGFIFGLLVT